MQMNIDKNSKYFICTSVYIYTHTKAQYALYIIRF